MPVKYKCRNCGFTLYEHVLGDYAGLRTPCEVAFRYGFKCPRCGSSLNCSINGFEWRKSIVIKPRREEEGKNKK